MYPKLISFLVSFVLFLNLTESDVLPTCQPKDFQYSFTECDEFGGRWRVSVPVRPHNCTGGAPNAPVRVDACFNSCSPGMFYNRTSLVCDPCQKGTYSLGGGVKYTSFNSSTLNKLGFRITDESPKQSNDCPHWTVRNGIVTYIASDLPTDGCVSVFTYTVKIVKRGRLKFNYQYLLPDGYSSVLFTFQYRNYEDVEKGTGIEGYNIKFPSLTREQQWKPIDITLRKPGLYIFIWKSVLMSRTQTSHINYFAKRDSSESPTLRSESGMIRIKSIEVDGVAYTSECTPCEPGTFSSMKGQSYCKLCPKDTFSDSPGSIECKKCASSEYASPGSTNCTKRPICNENDLYEILGECDKHTRKQRVSLKYIEPKICIENSTTSYIMKSCSMNATEIRRCSPGMEFVNNTCKFCPDNYYNNGSMEKCEQCLASTLPDYMLLLDTWRYPISNSPVSHLSSQCVLENGLSDDSGCDEDTIAWQMTPATHSYIRSSSLSFLNSYLLLTLTVDGFRSAQGGHLSFKFELVCMEGDSCHFMFMETKGHNYLTQVTNVVQEWTGDSKGQMKFKYVIDQNSSLSLSWIFKRKLHLQSHAKIYEIQLTNTIGTGASRCKPCPHGEENTCVPCAKGHYLGSEIQHIHIGGTHTHVQEKKCMKCPPNTIVNASTNFPIGIESCVACGNGLKSNDDNTACYSDCRVTLDGDFFDLSQIKQPLFMKGSHLFTSGGTQYFHFFNITLCGVRGSVCVSNISSPVIDTIGTQQEMVESMICRSTIVPDPSEVYATQPVSLGDELIGITKATNYKNISVHPEFSSVNSDIHLYYVTKLPTVACKNGRTLVVTLRCSLNMQREAILTTPKSCPDGTCDGCNFHILIQTKKACRMCKDSDYETIVGECVKGLQDVHYINAKACIFPLHHDSRVRQRPCSVIPRQVQLGIIIVSFLGILLVALVFHFWKKNQRLEYKYSKLVENKNSAECCASEDGEDDDDDEEVKIRQPKKQRVSNDNGYETIQLTKHSDIDDIM